VVLDAVEERFIEHSPISVMARLGLQRTLDPAWIDELFEQERETQYTRELLFSTTVDEIRRKTAQGPYEAVNYEGALLFVESSTTWEIQGELTERTYRPLRARRAGNTEGRGQGPRLVDSRYPGQGGPRRAPHIGADLRGRLPTGVVWI